MANQQPADPTLSEAELRRMLLERRAQDRERRMQAFLEDEKIIPMQNEAAERANLDPLAGPQVRPYRLRLKANQPANKTLDRMLLLIESLAVMGLIAVFIAGLNLFNQLNEQVSIFFSQQVAPLASPIVLTGPAVLPSGHTAPSDNEDPQPNLAEIPEEMELAHRNYSASLVAPAPAIKQAQSIQIPGLDLHAPIVQGDDWESLKLGVGQHIGSADPGEFGNLVLSGHNDIFGQVFRYLDQLAEGDEIVIHTDNQAFTYVITSTFVTEPTHVEVMFPTDNATLTLISCYPYLIDSQRIIIQAELQ
jgi:sortase A